MRAQIALVALAFGSLLFYSGFGLVRLLAFDRIRGGELVLAPAAGAALLITVGSWSGSLGWSAAVALAIALAVGTILNLLALRSGRLRSLDLGVSLGGAILAILLVAVAVAPLWMVDRPATAIGLNGDQVSYTNLASYLARQGLPMPAPHPLGPAATQRWLVDDYGSPLGFSYVHAMVDRLTGQPAYVTFSIVTAVFLALNVLGYLFVAERVFGLGRRAALVAGVLAAASPALMWIHYNNYAMHALAVGLIPAALAIAVLALEDGGRRGLMLAALLLSAVFVSYPPAAGPFLLAPVGAYGVLLAWRVTGRAAVIKRGVTLGLLMLAINLAGLVYVAKVLRPMVGFVLVKEFGDVMSHVSWAQLFGLVHHALPEPPGWATLGITVLAAMAVLLAAYGAAGSTAVGRRVFLSLIVTAVPFLLWLRFGLDYPYGFYKGLTFMVSPVLIGLALGVRRSMRAPAVVRASALTVLLVVGVASGANLLREAQTAPVFDFGPMKELSELARLVPRDQAVHVRDESGTALLWLTFFLQDRSLYLGNYSPYYLHRRWPFYQEPITAPLVLVNRGVARVSPWEADTVYENRRYRVVRKDPAVLAHLDFSHEPRALLADQQLRVAFLPDRTVVDGRPIAPGVPIAEGSTLALGLWAAGASTLRLVNGGHEQAFRVDGDRDAVSWPAARPPWEVVIVNVGPQTVLVPGWIAVVRGAFRPTTSTAGEGPLTLLRDEVLPGSGFFAVDGWHGLEGSIRWSRAAGIAVFKNPRRPSSLLIDCAVLRPSPLETSKLVLLLNGQSLGKLTCSGRSREAFPLSAALLGESSWGSFEIRVDPVFVPKAAGISADDRDLGVLVRDLRLEPGR